jgi:arsenate reductase (glutaredoxin)
VGERLFSKKSAAVPAVGWGVWMNWLNRLEIDGRVKPFSNCTDGRKLRGFNSIFEKPGCINGEKQKRILIEGGNVLDCVNILEHPWSREELSEFFLVKTPSLIMNHTAPAIKKGQIIPANLQYDEAVTLMIEDPILIKRPLIRVDGLSIQGFMDERLAPYLGAWNGREDVVTCPNLQAISCDESKKKPDGVG